MALYKKLDFWSINEALDKFIDYDINGNIKESQSYDEYADQITEMSVVANRFTTNNNSQKKID